MGAALHRSGNGRAIDGDRNRVAAEGGGRQRWGQFEGLWYGPELAVEVLRTATLRNKYHPCILLRLRWCLGNRKRRPHCRPLCAFRASRCCRCRRRLASEGRCCAQVPPRETVCKVKRPHHKARGAVPRAALGGEQLWKPLHTSHNATGMMIKTSSTPSTQTQPDAASSFAQA